MSRDFCNVCSFNGPRFTISFVCFMIVLCDVLTGPDSSDIVMAASFYWRGLGTVCFNVHSSRTVKPVSNYGSFNLLVENGTDATSGSSVTCRLFFLMVVTMFGLERFKSSLFVGDRVLSAAVSGLCFCFSLACRPVSGRRLWWRSNTSVLETGFMWKEGWWRMYINVPVLQESVGRSPSVAIAAGGYDHIYDTAGRRNLSTYRSLAVGPVRRSGC